MGVRAVTSQHARSRGRHRLRSRRRLPKLGLLAAGVVVLFGYQQVRSSWQQPQAILVLGGEVGREKYAANFALTHPELPVWISSGAPKEYSEWVFAEAGVEPDRLKLDYRAVDTLTNFTTLVDDLKQRQIKKVYLITSDYHMRRSRAIGEIVLGSRGIAFQTVAIPSDQAPEDMTKVLRDSGRALVWVVTGYTGYEQKSDKQSERKSDKQPANPVK